ncbi:MAG: molybdenum cofactor biosynthesis protein MoaE [Coriobacteriales bacterium]|nr:molybdenum cofactor biosynthesis protein MoaE [Coriobacteriales bacterium]
MQEPNVNEWLAQAKQDPNAYQCGMYLLHNGTVRETPKAQVRRGMQDAGVVTGLNLSHDDALLAEYIEQAKQLPGIFYVRVWLNSGHLELGDSLMYVLIGGDIRPHVVDALQWLVGNIKDHVVIEQEELA